MNTNNNKDFEISVHYTDNEKKDSRLIALIASLAAWYEKY
jgi:hypothetical protein